MTENLGCPRVFKEKLDPVNAFLQELLRAGVYKRSQGRITRQVTFAALAITVLLGLWRLSLTLRAEFMNSPLRDSLAYGVPVALMVIGIWMVYRSVNFPPFADFLIAVEAEMNKVSWPGRTELTRASLVVLVSIVMLGFLLAGFDFFWIWFFRLIGVYTA